MEAKAFLVFRDGDFVREGILFDDKHLKGHLLSCGALTVNLSGIFSITFVGFVVWKSWLLLFLPKGYDFQKNSVGNESGAVARLILRVLKKYSIHAGTREPDARRLSRSLTDPRASAFAVATWLADDFSKHGIYRRNRSKFTLSGNGTIDWTRTISKRNAHVLDGNVHYLECITRGKVTDDSYFITRLHVSVLSLCIRRYGEFLNLDRQALEFEGIAPLDDGDIYRRGVIHLSRELRHAYADRSIHLLRVLDNFLRNQDPTTATAFEIYGTSYFENIWEEICSTVIGNDIRTWSNSIPKPTWQANSGELVEAATLRPDIVRQYKSNGLEMVLLVDAKYYSLSMPPLLSGNPGVGDVIKQLAYQLTIAGEASKRGVKFSGNFFLFPKTIETNLFTIVGTVNYDGIVAGPIKVAYVDISKAMTRYVSERVLSENEMVGFFG